WDTASEMSSDRASAANGLSLSGSGITTAAGLASANAVTAPAHDASTTGVAPASAKACDKAPAGRPATIRIGPCNDIGRAAQNEKPAEGGNSSGPPLTSGQRCLRLGCFGPPVAEGIGKQRVDADLGQFLTDGLDVLADAGKPVARDRVGQGGQ